MVTHAQAVLGLDIGGSKTHAVRLAEDSPVGETVVGSANVASVGVDGASRALDEVVDRLGADVAVVCAGAAGADTEAARARLAQLLAHRYPQARIQVVHDTRIILAAAGHDSGAVLISGTGSAAWALGPDGREARAGGWGYLLGDDGSGYAIAREAVRAGLHEMDTGSTVGALTTRMLADCGLDQPWQLLDHFYQVTERRYWAHRAGIVFELAAAGDATSKDIVDGAATALTDLVMTVLDRTGATGPVVAAGGVAVHQPALVEAIRDRLARHGVRDVQVLDRDPVHGAVALAQQSLDSSHPISRNSGSTR